jgi:ABC-type multidrug transport system fused ATPase/permease subunit
MTLFIFIGPCFQSVSVARGAAASVFRLIDEVNSSKSKSYQCSLSVHAIQVENTTINERDVLKEDTSDEESIYDMNGDIVFENINFTYPSRKDISVLRNITLVAPAGQTIALVGSSGCGKLFPTERSYNNSICCIIYS